MARGRGRIAKLDSLPPWADEARMRAYAALKERKLSQLEILDALNTDLRVAALAEGITDPPQISRAAFNRAALRLAVLGRRLQETREIAAVLAPRLDQAADESVTLMVAESIKMLAHEMLSNAGELDADGATAQMLMYASRALKHAEEAKRISAEARRKLQTEIASRAEKAAAQAIGAATAEAAAAGKPIDGGALIKRIREDIYGIFER